LHKVFIRAGKAREIIENRNGASFCIWWREYREFHRAAKDSALVFVLTDKPTMALRRRDGKRVNNARRKE
jgi:hypothetical protein